MSKQSIFHTTAVGDNPPKDLNCIIEIPKGSNNKYEFDKETGAILLDRVLYSPFFYPVDYGLIPQTWNKDDNDPLDMFVFTTNPLIPGCVVNARVIGVLHMVDSGEKDDKIVGVPTSDPRFDNVNTLDDIAPHILKEIKHFFETYKDLQKKKVEITGWGDIETAEKIIEESIEEYKRKFA